MDDTLPPVDSSALPAAENKRLRDSHPLYGRMNGEVIWMAYEELGLDAGACATAMDAELALRRRTLDIMATLERSPGACCVPELPDAPCASCTACPDLAHLYVDAAAPQWQQWLPPYAIGCRVHARLLSHEEARQAGFRAPEGSDPPGAGCSARVLHPKRSPRQRILTLSRKKACLLGKAWVKELLARPCWMHGSLPAQCAAAVTRLCRIYDTHSFLHIRRTS